MDISKLRVSPSVTTVTVEKVDQPELRRPSGKEFFRVRPGDEYVAQDLAILEAEADGRKVAYILTPDVAAAMQAAKMTRDFFVGDVVLGVTMTDAPLLIPVRADERASSVSFRSGIAMAQHTWVRIQWAGQAYDVRPAEGEELPSPVWPKGTLGELLDGVLRERLIDTMEHPVIQRLRGIV